MLLASGTVFALSACGDGGVDSAGTAAPVSHASAMRVAGDDVPEGLEGPDGEFNIECTLSHTLPDDPVMMFGQPGKAMVHDFFGNIHADAFTTADKLLANPQTTCTSRADGSAYWAPQMRRKSTGEIIKPFTMKTYYRNQDSRHPVTPFPKGLQLLAGDHHSTKSKPEIMYYCKFSANSGKYYYNPPASCPIFDGEKAQFNLAIEFPNCWDGKNLAPSHHGPRNAAYSVDGVCPANYPVKIPQLQMNLGYFLEGGDNNVSDLELSMNPQMAGDVAVPVWGNLYTSHADFFNGWRADTMDYMVKYCFNRGADCNKAIPVLNAPASDDAYVRGGTYANNNFGAEKQMLSQRGTPGVLDETKVAYMKFVLPDEDALKSAPYKDVTVHYRAVDNAPDEDFAVFFYETSADWSEQTLTQKNAPQCGVGPAVRAWIGKSGEFKYRDSDELNKIVEEARKRSDRTVSLCMMTKIGNKEIKLGTKESGSPATLFFK